MEFMQIYVSSDEKLGIWINAVRYFSAKFNKKIKSALIKLIKN